MGFYDNHILPHLIDVCCSAKQVRAQRHKVVTLAEGRVLEVGFGTAENLACYDVNKVKQIWGLEPSEGMLKLARKRLVNSPVDVTLLNAGVEQIPLDDNSVDSVLLTYTLCSITEWMRGLSEIRRVLKPDGSLIFCEHGAAPEQSVLKWQNRINPLWKKIAGGCNLNRPVPSLLGQSGFRILTMDTAYLPKTPRLFGYNYWGVARPE
ncbi:MAG: class I SAM-dependent methyltransferase [Pseudomonadales bacterium]